MASTDPTARRIEPPGLPGHSTGGALGKISGDAGGGDYDPLGDEDSEHGYDVHVPQFGADPVGGHEDEGSFGWVQLPDDLGEENNGTNLFRMPRLCNMKWRDDGQRGPGSFEDCIVRAAPFSGPIAVAPKPTVGGTRGSIRLGRVRADAEMVPRIYDPDGVQIGSCDRPGSAYGSVSIEERGQMIEMGWDGSERLVCVWEKGIVSV